MPMTTSPTDDALGRQLAHEGLLLRLAAQLAADPALTGPVDATEIAAHAAAQFRACLPLLDRTGTLAQIGLRFVREVLPADAPAAPPHIEGNGEIDPGASDIIARMGADDCIECRGGG